MAMLDGAAQSAARSAEVRRVSDVMQQVRDARALIPTPPVSPGLPSLSGTPTRTQPPAEAAPAAATPTTGRGSRPRDETDEQPRREPRPREPPPEPMQQPDWIKEVAAKIDEAARAEEEPAEAAPAAATPTTGRGTRRGRDEDAPPVVARDTSGLDGLPAPRDSKDASGKPYDNAASWVDDRVEKVKALLKKLQQQEQVTPSPLPTPPPKNPNLLSKIHAALAPNPSPSLNPNPNPNPNTDPNPRWRGRRLRRVRRRRR